MHRLEQCAPYIALALTSASHHGAEYRAVKVIHGNPLFLENKHPVHTTSVIGWWSSYSAITSAEISVDVVVVVQT